MTSKESPAGWQLVQLAVLLQTAEQHLGVTMEVLRDLYDGAVAGSRIVLNASSSGRLQTAIAELAQLVERADRLVDELPSSRIEAEAREIAESAARDLADGIYDADRARAAARILDVERGWPALAKALRGTDAHTAWEATTIADVLGAFRGVSPQRVRRVATAAGLAPGAPFASCNADEAIRLAAQMEGA